MPAMAAILKMYFDLSLRKQAYSNILKILPSKNEKKKIDKNSYIFGLNIFLFPKYYDYIYINDIYTNYRIRTEA